jgi:hypothetical protein
MTKDAVVSATFPVMVRRVRRPWHPLPQWRRRTASGDAPAGLARSVPAR